MENGLTDRVGLVLVHGLFSSPQTWSSFEELIAGDPDLEHIETLPFGYVSPVASFNPLRRIPSFDDVADSLRVTSSLIHRAHRPRRAPGLAAEVRCPCEDCLARSSTSSP